MQIDIPNDDYQTLASHAAAAGYADVGAYVVALTDAVPVSAEELVASLTMLRESEADLAAGRVRELGPALREIADKYGLSIER